MPAAHPLDHVVWSALTGRQAHVAVADGGARRFDPAFGVFAAVERRSTSNFAALARLTARGDVALLEPEAPPAMAGLEVVSQALGVQMTAERIVPSAAASSFEITPLDDADGPQMLALAQLTEPGPFFERTHQLGDFLGVKIDGRLAAMAGERMKPEGHTEVSGVCTHPDFRGRGLAQALTRAVAAAILGRGETPFLHAYASNTPAIAMYERLGFRRRREVWMTRLAPSPDRHP